MRRLLQLGLTVALAFFISCRSAREPAQVRNVPGQNVPGQMDKLLFERAAQAYAQNQYLDIFIPLQTLKDTWPDSPYIARGNQILNDCRRKQECNFYLKQEEALPPDGGMIFFPNMPDTPNRKANTRHGHASHRDNKNEV